MREQRIQRGWLPGVIAAALSVTLMHCTSTTTSKTASVSQALASTSNSSDAVEAAGLMRGPDFFAPDAVEGFRCDPNPTVTTVTVCGKTLPATVHMEWTSCVVPEGQGCRGPGPDGAPRAFPDGGQPPDGDHARLPPPPGACGTDGGTCMAGGPPPPGPSSGTVDITNSYTEPDGCEGAIVNAQTVTFSLSRTDPRGNVDSTSGTSSSTEEIQDGPPLAKSSTFDVTHTKTDSSGAVVISVNLTGTRSVALSSDTPPTRTVNETVTATYSDGTTTSIQRTDVVHPPMSTCRWPTSGTQVETLKDGTTHTLVYGPTCGSATLDGTTIQLQKQDHEMGGPPPGHGRGPM